MTGKSKTKDKNFAATCNSQLVSAKTNDITLR